MARTTASPLQTLYSMVECLASQCRDTWMHGQVKDVVVACLVHRSRISNSPTEDRYLKKRLRAQLCHMPMNVFCMSFRLIFTGLLFISIIKSLVMYISASWFSYSLVTSVRLFNFGHLSLSYQPHIVTEISTSGASMIICYALNSFILDVTLFWILCIRTKYKMSANL